MEEGVACVLVGKGYSFSMVVVLSTGPDDNFTRVQFLGDTSLPCLCHAEEAQVVLVLLADCLCQLSCLEQGTDIPASNSGSGFWCQEVRCQVGNVLTSWVPILHKYSCLVCFTPVAKACGLFPSCHFHSSVGFYGMGLLAPCPAPLLYPDIGQAVSPQGHHWWSSFLS